MALVTLVEATPWIVSTGAEQAVRLAGGGRRAYDHLGHSDWRAGIVDVPKFKAELGFDASGWTGATVAQNGMIRFVPSDPETLTSLSALFWNGCPVTVKLGDDKTLSPSWEVDFTGTVANAAVEAGGLNLSVVDNGEKLNVPVTIERFAGTGGIEGDGGVAGRLKRRSWGACWNIEARVLLAAHNIYEVGDPAYKLEAIDTVKDIGRAADDADVEVLNWQGSIAATLTMLIAADVPEGGAIVAPSIACIKWWTQPLLLTADIRGEIGTGYVDAPAEIAERLAALGGISIINTAAMVAARPASAGLHIGGESETIALAMDRLLLGASLNWQLGKDGLITIREWSFDSTPAASLRSVSVSRLATYPPMKSRRVGYRRNERVHSAGEISAIILAADVNYADGTPVQDLQPAEAGATRGAPEGTFVADMLAEEVLAQATATLALVNEARSELSQTLATLLQTMMLAETREARMQAISYLDGDALHTVQRRETVERIEGDTAIVTDMALIGAKSLDGSAWILDLSTVKVGPTETFGERLSEIDAAFTAQGADIAANYTELTTAIATEESARVTAIDTLTATVDTLESNTAASIATVEDAIADETSARASAITSLTGTVTTLSGTVSSNYSTLNTAISTEASARASAVASAFAAIGTNTASITSLSSALSTLTSTEASHYSALTASIGGVSSTVTTHTSAIANLNGRTASYWEITTNAGSGASAFIAARAETSPGSITSNVAFGAREVHISNPVGGAWTKVLSISGGNVQVYGKLTATDAVTTPNIVANNVTQMESTLSSSAVTSDGGWKNFIPGAWHTFTLAYTAEVLVIFTGRLNYFGSTPSIVRLLLYNASETLIGATEGPSTGDGGILPNPTYTSKWALSPGVYHIQPQFLCDAGDAEMRSGSGVIVFWRYK